MLHLRSSASTPGGVSQETQEIPQSFRPLPPEVFTKMMPRSPLHFPKQFDLGFEFRDNRTVISFRILGISIFKCDKYLKKYILRWKQRQEEGVRPFDGLSS